VHTCAEGTQPHDLFAEILANIRHYGPAELADVARVYSRHGLNPEDEQAGADGTLFDALARQTAAQIHTAELQDVLRWALCCLQANRHAYSPLSSLAFWWPVCS
jgi:hypothetical protein